MIYHIPNVLKWSLSGWLKVGWLILIMGVFISFWWQLPAKPLTVVSSKYCSISPNTNMDQPLCLSLSAIPHCTAFSQSISAPQHCLIMPRLMKFGFIGKHNNGPSHHNLQPSPFWWSLVCSDWKSHGHALKPSSPQLTFNYPRKSVCLL